MDDLKAMLIQCSIKLSSCLRPRHLPPADIIFYFFTVATVATVSTVPSAPSYMVYGVLRLLQVWAAVIARWILNFLSSNLKIFLEVDRICDEPTTSLHSVVINVRLRNEDWLFSLFCRLLESKPNNNSPAMRNFTAILSITEARLFPILEIATS